MKIVLYDCACKGRNGCWSPNCWKARVALNFKALPYETEFLEYPEIEPKLKSLGVVPNERGTPFTLPSVSFGDETIMDSKNIVQKLEEIQPEPSLHLDTPMASEVENIFMKTLYSFAPLTLPYVPRRMLNAESVDHYYKAREKNFGVSLDEVERTRGGEPAWRATEDGFRSLIDLLKREPGPFFSGERPSWSDFKIASVFEFLWRLDRPTYDRVISLDGTLVELYQACKPWMAKDD